MGREDATEPGVSARFHESVPYTDLEGVYTYANEGDGAQVLGSAPSGSDGSSLYPQVGVSIQLPQRNVQGSSFSALAPGSRTSSQLPPVSTDRSATPSVRSDYLFAGSPLLPEASNTSTTSTTSAGRPKTVCSHMAVTALGFISRKRLL